MSSLSSIGKAAEVTVVVSVIVFTVGCSNEWVCLWVFYGFHNDPDFGSLSCRCSSEEAPVDGAVRCIPPVSYLDVALFSSTVGGGVDAYPISRFGEYLYPGMGSTCAGDEAVHIAGDNTTQPAEGYADVGIVLAYPLPAGKSRFGRGVVVGALRCVAHGVAYG